MIMRWNIIEESKSCLCDLAMVLLNVNVPGYRVCRVVSRHSYIEERWRMYNIYIETIFHVTPIDLYVDKNAA